MNNIQKFAEQGQEKRLRILTFDPTTTAVDKLSHTVSYIQRLLPDETIVAIPRDSWLICASKEDLIVIRDKINEMIDASDYDALSME